MTIAVALMTQRKRLAISVDLDALVLWLSAALGLVLTGLLIDLATAAVIGTTALPVAAVALGGCLALLFWEVSRE